MKSRLLLLLCFLLVARLDAVEQTELTADTLEMVSVENETRALCVGNVVLTGTNLRIVCDRLEIVATNISELGGSIPVLEKFKYLLATGNVRLVQGDREVTCGRAEVFPREEKIVLTEEPVLIDRASDFWAAGEEITLFRGEQRVHVKKPRAVGPPIKDLGPNAGDTQESEQEKADTPPAP